MGGEVDDLLEEIKDWTPQAQEKALALLKQHEQPPRIWYCHRGRSCNGKPHDGVEHPHARGDQWPPAGSWRYWIALSGRGSGKTRMGSEWIRKMSEHAEHIAMVGRTGPDVRNTMVEGDSGLIRVCEAANVSYTWEPSRSLFTFANGCKVYGFSAEKPDRLRGPQYSLGWLDEPAHMASIKEVWDNLMFGLRIKIPGGTKVLITSTPKPIPWLKKIVEHRRSVVARVSTYANMDNLDEDFREALLETYEGTRLGRQELHGEILGDVEGALWNWELIEQARFHHEGTLEDLAAQMDRIVVSIDPAGTAGATSDETGIVVAGRKGKEIYVLNDSSGRYTPERWARKAVDLYDHWEADAIVVERNYGGDMVTSVLNNISAFPRVKDVTSRRGKTIRAEPVFSLYEQGLVKHVQGLEGLETQMCEWVVGDSSPDRIDALVHGVTELTGTSRPAEMATASGLIIPASSRRTYNPKITRPAVRSWL